MRRMAVSTITFIVAVVAITLVAAGCSATPVEMTATRPASQVAAAQPCAAKPVQPCAVQAQPCAAKPAQPCAAQPCAAQVKQPCAAQPCAPGAKLDPKLVTRPVGTQFVITNRGELVKLGEQLWNDPKLSTTGVTCQTCHINHGSFLATFSQPYPHQVAMAKERAGMDQVDIDEMVQLCMVVPMAADPLPWDSKELAALSAYSLELQKTFDPAAAPAAVQPCVPRDPCAAQPCAAQPCAVKGKNPCSANPCAPRR